MPCVSCRCRCADENTKVPVGDLYEGMEIEKMGRLAVKKRRRWPAFGGALIRNRQFSQDDLVAIRRLIREHPSWGRTKLSQRICADFGWKQSNGRLKERACRVALRRLEKMNLLILPRRLVERGGRPPAAAPLGHDLVERSKITTMPATLDAIAASTREESRLWNSVIAAHHYLGLATPVGKFLRYLVYGDGALLAAISFSEAAWNIRARNAVLTNVGVEKKEIHNVVVGNNRFLVLPSVTVPNLASRILGYCTRRLPSDWSKKFGIEPLVAETFVDPTRFAGTCYLAANWIEVGTTRGYAKHGAAHLDRKTPKLLFLRGLNGDTHSRLILATKDSKRRAA